MEWPGGLPKADTYIAVWRYAEMKSPGSEIIKELVDEYQSVKLEAQKSGQRVVGLQLDYDCPTKHLQEYALFLKNLRAVFPRENIISITALLDWFRPQTGIESVIRQVDEYVPQFYDIAPEHSAKDKTGIAQIIAPARWAGIFNSYGRPYRIGIASFGRIVEIGQDKKSSRSSKAASNRKINILDYSPLEIMAKSELERISNWTSEAGEIILKYKVRSRRSAYYWPLYPGAIIKMIFPTEKSVSSAYTAARAMGGWCKGVVFFRWPMENEAMAFSQREINNIMSEGEATLGDLSIETQDGLCAAVSCMDLYLRVKKRFPKDPLLLRIRLSNDLEYFLPDGRIKIKPTGPRTIDVAIPAYAGAPKIYLGRAVTIDRSSFILEELRK